MREALGRSRNVPALKAMQEAGLENAKDFANGIGLDLTEVYESSAIGGLEHGVTTLQMAGAYSAFGNNGYYTEPHSVKEIEFRDGTKINLTPETKVAMSDYTAFMISDMLKSVLTSGYGTGRQANIPGLPVAGKTGTTNYSDDEMKKYGITDDGAVPDAWFAGYTTNYTAAVWTGYEKRENYIDSGNDQKIAMKIFKNVMKHVSEDIETADFTEPKTVQSVKVEKGSNPAKLAGKYTPEDLVIYEYAVKGNAPSSVSEKYKKPVEPVKIPEVPIDEPDKTEEDEQNENNNGDGTTNPENGNGAANPGNGTTNPENGNGAANPGMEQLIQDGNGTTNPENGKQSGEWKWQPIPGMEQLIRRMEMGQPIPGMGMGTVNQMNLLLHRIQHQ